MKHTSYFPSLDRFMYQGSKKNLGQKLRSMISSATDSKKMEELDNPQEIIRLLIDLVSIPFMNLHTNVGFIISSQIFIHIFSVWNISRIVYIFPPNFVLLAYTAE